MRDVFLHLVRLGIGVSEDISLPKQMDWGEMKALADQQGLSAVVLDGIDKLNTNTTNGTNDLPVQLKLEWIGEVLQGEQTYQLHQEVATDMANLFHANAIRTYVLKGRIVSECYPKPNHRVSSDMDCYLLNDNHNENDNNGVLRSHEEAWNLGNELIKAKHFNVYTDFYKNSTFKLPGLTIENHQYLTPFRGNELLTSFERVLQSMLVSDKGEDVIEGTWLYRPPVMVSALFLIEHAFSHFLHEGLTWRMVLDWVMFRKKHQKEINWTDFEAYVDEFGFRRFYNSFVQLGKMLMGDIQKSDLNKAERMMLADVWAPLDLHETLHGLKAKFQLAGNYWRARWKYKYFTDMTWIRALYEWVSGATLDRYPTLQ